jgi:hypothetical protein
LIWKRWFGTGNNESPILDSQKGNKMKKLLFALILIFFCFSDSYAFLSKEEPINPKDYPFFILAEDLLVYGLKLDLSGSAEKSRLKKWINGTYDFKYEYDRRDNEDFHPLFFSVKLEIEKNVKKAKKTYKEAIAVVTRISSITGMPCREIEGQIKWGDESYYAIREKEGAPVGLIFVTRYQNKVYTLIMAGLYSSDHSLITDIVLPKLPRIKEVRVE